MFWVHLQKVARRKEMINESQGKFRMVFENIGLDPHFLHADLYCELALSRVNPDLKGKAFGDYGEEARAAKSGEHVWTQQMNPEHWRCDQCGITVKVTAGETAQGIAEKRGWKDCRG